MCLIIESGTKLLSLFPQGKHESWKAMTAYD